MHKRSVYSILTVALLQEFYVQFIFAVEMSRASEGERMKKSWKMTEKCEKKLTQKMWVVIFVKLNFMKTISERLNSVNVAIISGHKWNENKFHIKYSSGRERERATTDSVVVGRR
jgi:hypothetical protein